jgi:hypothetical protein
MAYSTNLVALSLQGGNYAVSATQDLGSVDIPRMKQEGLFRDASDPKSGYEDQVGVLTPSQLQGYAVASNTQRWIQELPPEVFAVLVHEYEWESGLGD